MNNRGGFGLPTKILGSVSVIAIVAVLSVGATLAWFSSTHDADATIQTATVSIHDSDGFPLIFEGMLPGDTQTKTIKVTNGGTAVADFYVQMLGTYPPDPSEANFCQPTSVLDIRIVEVDSGVTRYDSSICNLYPGHTGSTIPLLSDDVAPGGTRTFQVHLMLSTAAGNSYQGTTNTDVVHLIGVQFNGASPVANKQGFSSGAYAEGWPADNYLPDDDPNYP